jgi:hypothetical protein
MRSTVSILQFTRGFRREQTKACGGFRRCSLNELRRVATCGYPRQVVRIGSKLRSVTRDMSMPSANIEVFAVQRRRRFSPEEKQRLVHETLPAIVPALPRMRLGRLRRVAVACAYRVVHGRSTSRRWNGGQSHRSTHPWSSTQWPIRLWPISKRQGLRI